METTVIEVALTPDDMGKIHRVMEELADVNAPEEALLRLWRAVPEKILLRLLRAAPGIETKRPDPFQTPGIPWEPGLEAPVELE